MISKRHWKKVIVLSSAGILLLVFCAVCLDISEKKGKLKSIQEVHLLFSSKGGAFPVKCEEDVKEDYKSFLSKYDPSAIKEVIQSPIRGKYIYLVISEGINPFIVDMSRSSEGTKFWIYRDGVENALKRVRRGRSDLRVN